MRTREALKVVRDRLGDPHAVEAIWLPSDDYHALAFWMLVCAEKGGLLLVEALLTCRGREGSSRELRQYLRDMKGVAW